MKKILIPTFAIIIANTAQAVDLRQYGAIKISDNVSSKVDIETINNKRDTEGNFGLSFSYGINLSDFRTELELSLYSKNKIENFDLDIKNQSLLLNVYYDIQTNSPFIPYAGIGLGYNQTKIYSLQESDDDATFAWKVAAGLAWKITENILIDAGYRFSDFGTFSQGDLKIKYYAQEIFIGARVYF